MLTLKQFLHREVKPALGCTEPASVALAVARARQELEPKDEVVWVQVKVSESIFKNGMAVGVPGVGLPDAPRVGLPKDPLGPKPRGNVMAAALAAVCGRAEYGLEALRDCQPADVRQAEEWVSGGRVQVECLPGTHGVYVEAVVASAQHTAACTIAGDHTGIVRVTLDGRTVSEGLPRNTQGGTQAPSHTQAPRDTQDNQDMLEAIGALPFQELLQLAGQMDDDDVDYIWQGVDMNLAIAKRGLSGDAHYGLGLGLAIRRFLERGVLRDDPVHKVRMICCAATDARMSGVQMPVMSSAGSGNHGIVAILPIAVLGAELGKPRQDIARAIVLSHLVTSWVKSRIGRLSPICGCTAAAGAGAAAGLVHLQGGSLEQMAAAAQTVMASTAGLICDGAKESCSLRVGTAAADAYLAAVFSLNGIGIRAPQGVAGGPIERTVENIGRLNREGMAGVDPVILGIMGEEQAKHRSSPPLG
ncbi:MAG: serine dehydratase subunit alpha family protein [Firmicutes bacterium]|nr:serine dehydratase subunit alpha family protein [Bacillota bacterium]